MRPHRAARYGLTHTRSIHTRPGAPHERFFMSVTAVPIRPLKKGAVAKLWLGVAALSIAAGAAAWTTTGRLIYQKTASGAEYQVVDAGEGASPDANSIAKIHVTIRDNGRVVENTRDGEPQEVPVGQLPPPLAEVLGQMKKGSTYRMRVTPQQLGAPPSAARPGAPPLSIELTLVDFRAITPEERQQAEMMRMMQQQMQQGGGPGGPGAPGAGPPGGAAGPEGAAPGASGPAGRSSPQPAPPPPGNSSR